MRKFPPVLTLLAALSLAGCWESEVSLYRGRTPVTPLRTGEAEEFDHEGKLVGERSVLTREAGGVYRLTGEKNGGSFTVRFFPLARAPQGLAIYEAWDRKARKFYYGLVRLQPDKVEVLEPDCGKDAATAKLPVKAGNYDCGFSDRARLEKALRALAREPWQPEVTYRYRK